MFVTIPQHMAANCGIFRTDPHLIEFAHDNTGSAGHPTRIGWFCSSENPKQGALASTIATHNADSFPFAHTQGNVTQ